MHVLVRLVIGMVIVAYYLVTRESRAELEGTEPRLRVRAETAAAAALPQS
jgi:hypothetical protein